MNTDLEKIVIRKVSLRLLPLITVLYLVSYIDRTNLGFAALTMNQALGFSPKVFGFGASLFFVGYVVFQLPGNLLLDRYGARRMTATIAFVWGICATGMAWIWNESSFYSVRMVLGAAEAAFFPGMIYYISLWFPSAYRGRVLALFIIANPLSSAIGFPLSAILMRLDGVWGLAGWQWVFVGEGLPAVILSFISLKYLTDRPVNATWLSSEEREWLVSRMEADSASRPLSKTVHGVWGAFINPRALILALGYYGIIMGVYGYNIWLPQIVKRLGLTIMETGFVSAIPYLLATPFMLYWGRRLDRSGDRGWYAGIACFIGCAGLVISALVTSPVLALVGLSMSAMGLMASIPTFWTIPTWLFSGTTAAACIAFVSSLGHLGGATGPYFMGFLREMTGNFTVGLIGLAMPLLLSGLIALYFRRIQKTPAIEGTIPDVKVK